MANLKNKIASKESEKRLGKTIGFWQAFAIGTGTMIGAGIFILPGIAITAAGPSAVISFILGGLISLATALSMAELATGMPRAGGDYYFISRAMGPLFGSIIGLGAWFALVFKGSFALIGLAEYLKVLFPVPILITAVTVGLLLLFINYRGAESSGKLQNIIVGGLFVILITFILRGLFMIEADNLTPFFVEGYGAVFGTTGLVFVSYLGITQLAAISEEVKEPAKNLPRVFIASVLAVTLLYVGIMLVISGVFPQEKVIVMGTPLVEVARLMVGPVGGIAIVIAGFLATVSTANAALLSSSRFPFAMGRDKLMPQWFIEIHSKYSTPYKAILFTGLTMIVLLLLFNVEDLARLASSFNFLDFMLVNLSVIILRRASHKWYKPTFTDPLYPFTQIIGIGGSFLLLLQVGLMPLLFVAALILLGIIWYITYGGRDSLPKYNLLDVIEKREASIEKLDEIAQDKKVLVPVSNPDHEHDLLHLADHLADKVVGLNVVHVPSQTSLRAARQAYEEDEANTDNILETRFRKNMEQMNKKSDYIISFDHDVPSSILEQAEKEKANLIIMGWQRKDRFDYRIGGLTSKVLARAKSNVAILKGHFPDLINEIVVAYDGGDNSTYALYLAKRLAFDAGAKVRVLRIINPDLSTEEKEAITSELEKLVEVAEGYEMDYELKERYSTVDGILESTKETDLTIMGDSNRRFRRALLGSTPQRVARHTENSILIVKMYKPISSESFRAFIGKFK
ncbi:amino acid permease [Fuchsiella alkaliacetigena]|uniref:amino acid permease n=1 Tax=Fuchsiella alkaliacetigena TaxID=957042 RepID=UPI00200AC565|nr:amino acid permease [Fuchsiella alkaliacetigena]MCK8823715.1 amino acid permease [Fuchsiella alkaliacetigena]